MVTIDRYTAATAAKLGLLPEQWLHYRNRVLTHLTSAEQYITRLETQHESALVYGFLIDASSRHLHAASVLIAVTAVPHRTRLGGLWQRLRALTEQAPDH